MAGADVERRRPRALLVGAAALVLLAVGVAAYVAGGDDGPTELTVEWGGTDEQPGCVYDAGTDTVEARLVIDGEAPRPTEVTLTVTAYSDENTSKPVGSATRTIEVEGSVHEVLDVTVPVEAPPFVDIDRSAACARTVDY